ncbi:activated protein kinase catalytic subunit alpha-1 [Seminavis robusta]|uniref:guanylate cyclase n=1 Tax=Seminavis robusta TaxID=568900 RepID=A0A9N8ESE3_9STRA|nr:activated protein kinase catalytic subunit alpha-1 [Seminavis robusta]|eukprot:Sro1546_g281380.1 activated protein kinase catalytic subunit alpha-1 (1324) ;mRNA; f:5460-11260
MKTAQWILSTALTALLIWEPSRMVGSGSSDHSGRPDCFAGLRKFDPLIHKKVYQIGVHAPGGIDTAWREFNTTFVDYLTATAGQRFDPPISFNMTTSDQPITDWVDGREENEMDFIYSDTGVMSCFGVEMGAQILATTVSHMKVRGHEYNLDLFGGVIFTRADNYGINTLNDLKDKVIGALDISDFAGGQVQFYVMQESGLDFIMDPKQVVFTDNQYKIVTAVRIKSDAPRFEIKEFLLTALFSFAFDIVNVLLALSFTAPIFPEWPLAATTHVPADVAAEVQAALLKLDQHKRVGERVKACTPEICSIQHCENGTIPNICSVAPVEFFDDDSPCDTTRELAELARKAGIAGNHNGFRAPRSYFELRTMQEAAGFLQQDDKGKWQCIRASTLYESVICPEGHYKVNRDRFNQTCIEAGLPCPEGHDCYCKPCVKAFEVDVYEYSHGRGDVQELSRIGTGCDKMDLCGTVEQTKLITFRAIDNKERDNAIVKAKIHMDQSSNEVPVSKVENASYTYEFSFTEDILGVGILEVFVDNKQIPESPFRVQIYPRDCNLDFPGKGMSPMADGQCDCDSGTIKIAGDCMSSSTFAIIISSIILVLALEIGYVFLRYKRRKSDEMWLVNVEELHFSEPVEVVGQGSFGVVLVAEYRGTKVAIKRALPPSNKGSTTRKGSKGGLASGSLDAKGSRDIESGLLDEPEDARAQKRGNTVRRSSVVSRGSALSKGSAFSREDTSSTPSAEGASRESVASRSSDLSFLNENDFEMSHGRWWAQWCPSVFGLTKDHTRLKSSILVETTSASNRNLSMKALFCPWFDAQSKQKEEFLEEMRLLSRLRHPCITTVMGAVVTGGHDPMLVMEYMEYGSLYDLLHSETMFFSGEICLQILRDIAQGLRYLHASRPPILHGDLKAKNILIDSRFRAKVCDFGLSTKKKGGISGTPFYLAPEYLRGKSDYNTTCDMYSVGIIIYELYSRQDPYKGENYKTVLRRVCDPRKNHRPTISATAPPKLVGLMKNLWSPDPFFRPQAKDLDVALMDMNMRDAEPLLANDPRSKPVTKDMFDEMFPKHVAEALKAGQKVDPEQHDLVTVVFAEIVHFQDIARKLPPMKVTTMLDRVFFALDRQAKEHEIFKVETVGECYMGVTNLGGKQEASHVKHVALFALAALEEVANILIDEDEPKVGHVHIHVGFHSGPVVTNVIGSLNPRYGLFGDTVNTASRMESNCLPNRIQCSEKSALILQEQDPDILVLKRGKVPIKGKGEMITYWVGEEALKKQHKDDNLFGKTVSFEGGPRSMDSITKVVLGSHDSKGSSSILKKKKASKGQFPSTG